MSEKRPLEGWRVLLVEDDFDSQMVASMMLKAAGAEVIVAENGHEGLEKVRQATPKFILCDLSMPIMDGWQFMEVVKADASLRHLPVIALTAHAMSGDRERALAAGFVNHITKPLHAAKFMTELVSVLVQVPEFQDHF